MIKVVFIVFVLLITGCAYQETKEKDTPIIIIEEEAPAVINEYEKVKEERPPFCGDGICNGKETWQRCYIDCEGVPGEDEDIISRENVTIVYNKEFGKWLAEDYLQDSLTCIKFLKKELGIDLPNSTKSEFIYYLVLVGDDENTFSGATSSGVTTFLNMEAYKRRVDNEGYFKEKIYEEQVCLNLHEMTHVFVSDTIIPGWANEGIATYIDEQERRAIGIECRSDGWYGSDFGDPQIKRVHDYSDLSKAPENPRIYWYYTGYCFWKYIEETYGKNKIRVILNELKDIGEDESINFLRDIVNKAVGEDITSITKNRFKVS